MDIFVRKAYKHISPFELYDLPDLVVLTGENGTGKTQLLNYIYQDSQRDEKGEIITPSEEDPSFDIPEPNVMSTEDGQIVFTPSCEIVDNACRINNIVLRPVQAPTVEVGGKYDLKKLYAAGENISQKHLFLNTHGVFFRDEEANDSNTMSLAFNNVLGIKRGNRSGDTILPSITDQDIDFIKRIEKDFSSIEYAKDPFYYIAYQQPPKTTVFAANLKFLYFQYWARTKAGLSVGIAPWEAFNSMGKLLNFKFELDEPNIQEEKFDVRLRDKERKVFISPDSLSSGEKVIFSLFVAMYSTNMSDHLPNLILFDEPDAFLHPSLSKTMLDVMQKVFIKEHNIKVIMTTHSPTTVALVPETSLFRMVDGQMQKCSKKDAILSLTSGLSTISVYYENVKQVFVEANNDNIYFTHVYHHAITKGWLNPEISLRFVNVGDEKDGGCDIVRKVVNDLAKASNNTVYGIIDGDGHNVSTERIRILGNGVRYAIDNYLLDPLSVAILCLEEPLERVKIGFNEHLSLVGFASIEAENRQRYIDNVVAIVSQYVPITNRLETNLDVYHTMDGNTYKVPHWYFVNQGHDLTKWIRQAFPFLNKYQNDKQLFRKIVETCYGNYPEIIPSDIIETFRDIQQL